VKHEYRILVVNLKGRDYSRDLSVDGKVMLKLILNMYKNRVRIEFIWLRIGTSGGLLFTR
jgi:hypothetical protein